MPKSRLDTFCRHALQPASGRVTNEDLGLKVTKLRVAVSPWYDLLVNALVDYIVNLVSILFVTGRGTCEEVATCLQ